VFEMKPSRRPWLAVAAVAVVSALWLRSRDANPIPEPGGVAPDFTLPTLDGGTLSLSALRGSVVAVNFWATWCAPCKAEIPDLAAVYAARGDRCLEVLGVAEDSGTREEVAAAAKELGINYPVLLDDAAGEVAELYEVPGYPRTVLVDADGRIRRVFRGLVHRAELEQAIAPLLAEAPAACARTRAAR
jgi:cytochrome c biogenesis protein CcmG/thiol:disulfide interchange protein DsbE